MVMKIATIAHLDGNQMRGSLPPDFNGSRRLCRANYESRVMENFIQDIVCSAYFTMELGSYP